MCCGRMGSQSFQIVDGKASKLSRWVSSKYDQALLALGVRLDEVEAEIDRGYDVNSEDWKHFRVRVPTDA